MWVTDWRLTVTLSGMFGCVGEGEARSTPVQPPVGADDETSI